MTIEPIDACAAAIAGVMHPRWSWNDLREYYKEECREAARACLEAGFPVKTLEER